MEKVLNIDTETKILNRERLRAAIKNSTTGNNHKKSYLSEARNTTEVPFEGTIYADTGTSVSSKNIQEMYNSYTPSVWWILYHTVMSPFLRIMK